MSASSRSTGYFPLSIGTSLAFEGILGLLESEVAYDGYKRVNALVAYPLFLINIHTLIRNLIQSIPTEELIHVNESELFDHLQMEVQTIQSIVKEFSPLTELVFYTVRYEEVFKRIDSSRLRLARTDLQKLHESIHVKLFKAYQKEPSVVLKDLEKRGEINRNQKCVLLTHHVIDLILFDSHQEKVLLESHTGKVKGKSLWYTKYYNGKALPILPLNGFLLLIFGDSEDIHPMSKKVKEVLLDLARRFKWTHLTTMEKIRFNIDYLRDEAIKAALKNLYGILP